MRGRGGEKEEGEPLKANMTRSVFIDGSFEAFFDFYTTLPSSSSKEPKAKIKISKTFRRRNPRLSKKEAQEGGGGAIRRSVASCHVKFLCKNGNSCKSQP